jgi:hypothetical protein
MGKEVNLYVSETGFEPINQLVKVDITTIVVTHGKENIFAIDINIGDPRVVWLFIHVDSPLVRLV